MEIKAIHFSNQQKRCAKTKQQRNVVLSLCHKFKVYYGIRIAYDDASTVTFHERHVVSNHWQLDYLFKSFLTTKELSKGSITGPLGEVTGGFPHKGQ